MVKSLYQNSLVSMLVYHTHTLPFRSPDLTRHVANPTTSTPMQRNVCDRPLKESPIFRPVSESSDSWQLPVVLEKKKKKKKSTKRSVAAPKEKPKQPEYDSTSLPTP